MKTLFITITITLYISQIAMSQISVRGVVKDDNSKSLAYTNLILLSATDSSLVKGTVSNPDGSFIINNIEDGNYILKTTSVGYEPAYQSIQVLDQKQLPSYTITMAEETEKLDEVVIKAQKPLYERMADRTVVNVQSRVTTSSMSVLEVLAASPGVIVNQQNNSIAMFGKNGVGIMINGKLSPLPIEAIVQMLNGMNASNVEKIELINSPPAKYDAEGVGGLINIVLKQTPDMGTNGNVSLTAGYNEGKTLAGSVNINHRKKGFSYFVDYSVRSDDNVQLWIEDRTIFGNDFDQVISIDQERIFNATEQFFRAGVSYDFSPATTINLLATAHKRNWYMDAITDNVNLAAPDSTINTTLGFYESNIWKDMMIGVGVKHKLSDNQTLEAQFDYLHYINDNPSGYTIDTEINNSNQGTTQLNVTKDTPLNFKVAKVDYTNDLNDKIKLQAGAKASLSALINNVKVHDRQQEEWIENERFTSYASLTEDVWAGYVSLNWDISNKVKLYSGLRYEFTDTYLSEGNVDGLVDREYGNFFPNFTISNQFSEESTISLAYSRRISRPSFGQIAPFVLFSGPNTFFAGNPALLPAITDGFDISYQLKSWWISAKYSTTNNPIQQFQPQTDAETGEQIYRSENMSYFNTWIITSSLPIVISSWWEIQNDISVNYLTYKTHDALSFDGFTWNASATHTFTLPRDFTIEVSGRYFSKNYDGLLEIDPYGIVGAGIKKSFKNSQLSISFNDIFDTFRPYRFQGIILQGQGVTNFDMDLNARAVNVTFSKTFGNDKLKKVNVKSGSEDERKRVN